MLTPNSGGKKWKTQFDDTIAKVKIIGLFNEKH